MGIMDGPAPGNQPLELLMECFNGSNGVGGRNHRVTVHPDWTVTTPHDAEAERIAEAFGSYTSCVTHTERIVDAFRKSFRVLTRVERVPLILVRGGSWQVGKGHSIAGCCRGTLFGGVVGAATHTRAPTHLARQHRVPLRHLEAFLEAASETWGRWNATPEFDPRIERLIREPRGIGDLWRAGLHPAEIATLARVGSVVDEPLPIGFYLGLVYGSVDPQWVSEVLSYRPDPDTASWLAWLDEPHKRSTSTSWGRWLSFGISKADVLVAVHAGIPAEQVVEVAHANGWPVRAVAAQFVKWANAGCTLKMEHFHALKRHGVYSPQPSRRAIDAVWEMVTLDLGPSSYKSLRDRPDRSDLAVMLEILGSRNEVRRAITHGARTPDDLDSYVPSYDG